MSWHQITKNITRQLHPVPPSGMQNLLHAKHVKDVLPIGHIMLLSYHFFHTPKRKLEAQPQCLLDKQLNNLILC